MKLLDELRAALPEGSVITDPDLLAGYRTDECGLTDGGMPAAVLRPRDTEQVSAALRLASTHRVPVVPQGARTGLAGGGNAIDGCLVLSMTAMNAIRSIDPVNRVAVVEPGVVNADVSRAAAEHGLRYPPDPGSFESSTIGGNVATNAGGMCCVKYGVTTEYVLGLEVVLADGEVLRCGRRTAKGVAGYDLTRLFCGSEGTLGVITEITLKLVPVPPPSLTLAAIFPDVTSAGAAVTAITAAGCVPSLLELIDEVGLRAIEAYRPMGLPTDARAVLLAACDTGSAAAQDLEKIGALCEASGATELHVASDRAEADMLLAARRMCYPALEKLGLVIVDDMAVPRSELARVIDGAAAIAAEYDVLISMIAHAGDGNVHPNIIVPHGDPAALERGRAAFDAIMALGLSVGGTCTGEHGVGLLKRDWLARELDPVAMRMQRAVKQTFDPLDILNPGKVLPVADA